MDFSAVIGRIGGELSDDLLEQILEGGESFDLPVLVDDQPDALVRPLEIEQLHAQRGPGGDEVGLARLGPQVLGQVFFPRRRDHPAQMQDPLDLVDVAAVQGDARVLGMHDLLEYLGRWIIEVDRVDLLARDHDVVHRDLLEIQDAHEHLPVAARDQRTRFRDDGSELLAAQGVPIDPGRRQPEQPQHPVRHPIDGDNQRLEDDEQGREDVRGGERDALGMQRRVGLGCHLGEYQDHQREEARRKRDSRLAQQAQRNHRRQRRCGDVHEVVAEQDQADEPVGAFEEPARASCAPMPGAGEMAKPVPVQGHHAGLGTGETRREDDEDDEGGDQDA